MAAGLFDHRKSCLIVIDVQQYFLDKLPLDWRQPLVERIAWLIRLARILDIPVVATAEDIAEIVGFVATRPPHVDIDQVIVRPRDQARVWLVNRSTTPDR